MKLTIGERLMVQGILASAEGNITLVKMARDLQGKVGLSQKEYAEAKITQEGNNVHWEKEITKEIELGTVMMDYIVKALRKMNEAEQLKVSHIAVYEKFCGEK